MFKIPKTITKDGNVYKLGSMYMSGTGPETEYRLTYQYADRELGVVAELYFEGTEHDILKAMASWT